MKVTLDQAVSAFGKESKARLSSAAVSGEPEDQLRGPFEKLLKDLAGVCGFGADMVVSEAESFSSVPERRARRRPI